MPQTGQSMRPFLKKIYTLRRWMGGFLFGRREVFLLSISIFQQINDTKSQGEIYMWTIFEVGFFLFFLSDLTGGYIYIHIFLSCLYICISLSIFAMFKKQTRWRGSKSLKGGKIYLKALQGVFWSFWSFCLFFLPLLLPRYIWRYHYFCTLGRDISQRALMIMATSMFFALSWWKWWWCDV